MSRKSYSKEFKDSAVRLMVMEGMPAVQVSQKLGVSEALLYKWKQLQVSELKPSDASLDPQALVSENEQLRKQLARAENINEILKNGRLLCGAQELKYQSIKESAPNEEVVLWCKVLDVSRSAYYNWLHSPYRVRALRDAAIKSSITEIDKVAANRYGYHAIHAHLQSLDVSCGKDRVLRLMHEMQLAQRSGKRFKPIGTNSRHNYGYHPNLLKAHGAPTACNQVWVADTTYIRVEGGFAYQATVMDLYNREIVGWSISSRNDTNLVTEALTNAFHNRAGSHAGLIHHSDRGSSQRTFRTYASQTYQNVLLEHGVKPQHERQRQLL